MKGTRESLLNQVMAWVTDSPRQKGNAYWLHGSPGIGKTSLAHSICARLHDQKRLAGAFFCRRDDPNLSEPRNILPTFINHLAVIFPPFRRVVANVLQKDPNLTAESMKYSLFLDLIRALPHDPKHSLVFVIDALDECGDDKRRPELLKILIDVAALAPWLKVIITSRPEADIQRFFDALHTQSMPNQYDLATDQDASSDLRTFARSRFTSVAKKWYLPEPWPEESLFIEVISRAAGLFVFIETVSLALEHCEDPTRFLSTTLQDTAGSKPLYTLYSNILETRITYNKGKFQSTIGVVLATASYRPLCEDAIATLAGVELNLVKMWMDALSSLLYRDEQANKALRVRHLSIAEFLASDHCHHDYRANLFHANMKLGTACLKTMIHQLRFNICQLEDSRIANADMQDLPDRIKRNIPEALQYSSLYWSNHVCLAPQNGDADTWRFLREFVEGLYPLFWIEVLSVLRMVHIGVPSLRGLKSWVEVCPTPIFHLNDSNLP